VILKRFSRRFDGYADVGGEFEQERAIETLLVLVDAVVHLPEPAIRVDELRCFRSRLRVG
jgi:hypothetical protein